MALFMGSISPRPKNAVTRASTNGIAGFNFRLFAKDGDQPSPVWLPGRPVHRPFRGLLSVHSRYGLHTRAATVFCGPLIPEGFSDFVTSAAAPVAPAGALRRVGLSPTGTTPPYHGARQKRTCDCTWRCRGYRYGAWKLAGSNHVLRDGVRLSNYPYAAAFVESIDILQGAGVATDNSGYLILSTIFGILPWKLRSIFSISFVLKPSLMISRW
jgi:hypothetical protein